LHINRISGFAKLSAANSGLRTHIAVLCSYEC
jgi:hypothetical protein